jgi:hypothetical protein
MLVDRTASSLERQKAGELASQKVVWMVAPRDGLRANLMADASAAVMGLQWDR